MFMALLKLRFPLGRLLTKPSRSISCRRVLDMIGSIASILRSTVLLPEADVRSSVTSTKNHPPTLSTVKSEASSNTDIPRG